MCLVDIFLLIMCGSRLLQETKKYAASVGEQSSHSSPRPWQDVSTEEMKALVGILILMGICRLP